MDKYQCSVCGFIYDPAEGDPDNGVAPGTAFEGPFRRMVLPQLRRGQGILRKDLA